MRLRKGTCLLCVSGLFVASLYFVNNYPSSQVSQVQLSYVDGWTQNTSKNVSDYVSETLEPRILPKGFCSQKGLLLVIVNTRPDNYEARKAIRETWGEKCSKVSYYFLVGEIKDHNYEIKLRLQEESEKYNDIIQEHFVDAYNNLTLKSINMLKLFHLHCAKSYKYLLKIDDDVFLNVENLVKMLENRYSDESVLMGKLIANTKPFRVLTSKWYVPYELYQEKKYPNYLCGAAYLMSSDVAQKLYNSTLKTPIFFIEDVYVTGICAKRAKVTPQHHAKFTCYVTGTNICSYRDLYTLHDHKPEQMRQSYRVLKQNKCRFESNIEWIKSFFV